MNFIGLGIACIAMGLAAIAEGMAVSDCWCCSY